MAIKFRDKALVKLRSPEQLDEPLQVIWQKRRLAYITFLSVIVLGLIWGVLGRLPKTGRGQGILMTPNSVRPVQAQADGQIGQWLVKVGDVVPKGAVLGILEQPGIERQLEQVQAKLREVTAQKQVLKGLRDRYSQLEKEAIQHQRNLLKERIDYLKGYIEQTRVFAKQINQYNTELLEFQKQNLTVAKNTTDQLTAELQQRLESFRRLRAENLTPEDTLRNATLRYDNSKLKARDLDLQAQEIDLSKIQLAQTFLEARNLIATQEHTLTQLHLQLQELDTREAQQDKLDREADVRDQNEIDDLRRTIERHQKQLQRDREIITEYDGRVLELTAVEGSVVNFGQRLLQLDTRRDNDEIMALAYFEDKIGKYLQVGIPVRVSPLTLDQKRYGSIRGEIYSVSDYPVTPEAVINAVGNQEVAAKLTQGGFQIEAFVKLKSDPHSPSGYAWTSRQGPEVEITAGTTADVWVSYEERSPISFVMPKLREWSGLPLSLKLGFTGNESSQNPSVAPARSR
jgi:HlyD family secretion protein